MEELKQEFLSEAYELLNTMEDGSLKLEQNPEDSDAIAGIFRVAHTLKGGAASLEITRVANFTHELENLFDQVRDGKIKVDEEIIDIILKSLDILKIMVDAAANNQEPQKGLEEETMTKIIKAQDKGQSATKNVAKKSSKTQQKDVSNNQKSSPIFDLADHEKEIAQEKANQQKIFWLYALLNPNYEMRSVSALQIYTAVKEIGEIIACLPTIDSILEEDFVPEIRFLIATDFELRQAKEKVFVSDVTLEVILENYEETPCSSLVNNEKNPLLFSDEVQEAIASHLEEGTPVYKISLEIEPDNPMRNVDSLLLYNTLEEIGEIISGSPTKEELKSDDFFQFIDVVLATSENKKRIKEKCYMSDTTKSIKIATIKAKDKPKTPVQTPSKKEEKPQQEKILSPLANKKTEKQPQQEAANKNLASHRSFLRVESGRVDILMNLVSELVISKAGLIETGQQILNIMDKIKDMGVEARKGLNEIFNTQKADEEKEGKIDNFFNYVSRSSWNELDNFENIINIISRVINELQESVMKIRMVPIGSIFNRFPRIVRDLSKNLNKDIELKLFGEDTELDKSVIEELLDPMVHMVRNSIDHGIENPKTRQERGKNPKGIITLGASHEGSMIKIEIGDDGKGLDPDAIKAKAIEKGMVTETKELSKEEILNLIFQPGFSTAQEVTEVSGRGVGMDVVKKKIENLSGSIFVETEKGKGSRFIIKIPLTLAIIQALIVEINSYSYSIPINSIVETLSIREEQLEMFENNKVIRLRDELITVINLKEIFNFATGISEEELQGKKKKEEADLDDLGNEKYIIVVEISNKKAGLMVDTVVAEQDIVIKPLHKKYAMTQGISGATILGDGRISLIIDIYQMIDMYVKKEEYITIK